MNEWPPPPSYELISQPRFSHADNYVNTTVEVNSYPLTTLRQRSLIPWRAMKYLAATELLLATTCIIFGSGCLASNHLISSFYDRPIYFYCKEGSGIWVGIFCSITGSLGLCALAVPNGRRCLLVSYFVMSILSTIGCGILLIFSSYWAVLSKRVYDYFDYSIYLIVYGLNLVLVASSLIHLVMSIVSASLICYSWNCCCGGRGSPTVTVVQSGARPEIRGHSSSYRNV